MLIMLVVVLLWTSAGVATAQPGATGAAAILNAEAKALSETDPDGSLAAARRAQAAARDARDVRGEAEALNYIAYGYRNQSLLDLARQSAAESIRLYAEIGDHWGEAQGYNTQGLIDADAGRFTDALANHLKALAIRERTGDKEGLAYSYNNLGNTHRNMGEYDKALEYHKQGLALKIRDDQGYWTQVEAYVSSHSAAEFTHSICPSCTDNTLYPDHLDPPPRPQTTRPQPS